MKEVLNMEESYKKLEQFRLAILGKKQPKQRKKKKEKIQGKNKEKEKACSCRRTCTYVWTSCCLKIFKVFPD